MQVTLLNRTFEIDPSTVLVRESGFYARVQLPGREGMLTHYVAVKLVYGCAEPPKPLILYLPCAMIGEDRKGQRRGASVPGVDPKMSVNVFIVTPPSLYHAALRAA